MFARRILRRAGLAAAGLLGAALLAAAAGALWVRAELRASLPRLEGEVTLHGLAEPVRVERDRFGVPTIRGSSRIDVARATGFVHAQDRYFQMDLLRRRAAGELAEILGPGLLPFDRQFRVHRFREEAKRIIARDGAADGAILGAYAEGVNAGLASLGARPFEYLALRSVPAPWLPEDSILVLLSMFLELQSDNPERESALGVMRNVLPGPMLDFLDPRGTEWDAPLVGDPLESPPVPGPSVIDLRKKASAALASSISARGHPWGSEPSLDGDLARGSNNWAVAGRLTASGGALLADDMHLGLSVPNIWYRASFSWPDEARSGEPHRVTGVTLPGLPAVAAGSNGHVAWGFTNTQGDWSDLVIVETDPDHPGSYLTPEGSKPFERHTETIRVRGGTAEILEVDWTIWGPVVGKDHGGRPRALRWVAHDETAVNLGLLRAETAGDLDEALDVANTSGIPAQNFVAADSTGRIGWTVAGAMPRRAGFDGRWPESWADGTRRWDGWLSAEEHPRVVDPESGRLWTANARAVDGTMLAAMGDGGYVLGARARQIRDGLFALERATAADMVKIQLDDRALFLERWRRLLLETLSLAAASADSTAKQQRAEARSPTDANTNATQPRSEARPLTDSAAVEAGRRRAEAARLVEAWGGRASTDSAAYRIVRAFRSKLAEQVFGAVTARCKEADPEFSYFQILQYEGPLWRLVSERPLHLLDPQRRSWDEQLLTAADAALAELLKNGPDLAARTWGERNTASIQHPLSRAVPFLARWLDMPRDPLPGDGHMPRVQGPTFGASERMVVSPGREEEGFFHMPGGQSGHPLSPHYGDGHAAWARGEPAPFLPGPAAHTLVLRP